MFSALHIFFCICFRETIELPCRDESVDEREFKVRVIKHSESPGRVDELSMPQEERDERHNAQNVSYCWRFQVEKDVGFDVEKSTDIQALVDHTYSVAS